MNKILSIILILSSVFMLSCHRDPEPNVIDHEFTDVKAVPQFTTCDISCQNLSVQQRENVHARVLYSLHEDLKEVETIPMEEDDSCLTCQVTGLAEGTLYYYTFEAYTSVEAYRAKEIYHFTTQVSSGISVTTGEVTDITQTTAKGRGMVNAAEGVMVTERGLCWGTGHNPTTQGTHLSNGYGTGEFFVELDELSPNTKYYVRAYAISATGTEYGTEVSFTTNSADLPEVVTGQVTGITATTAVGHGQVTSEGTSPVTERGVCWSTGHDPLVSDSHSNAGTGMGNFSVTLSGLTPNATYYLRAYATNEHGTAYGAEVSFKALEGQPEVETVSVTDITASSAIGHGQVTAQGGSAITARGFCWSTEHNPTTESSHIAAGEGMGEFDATIEGLAANTRYYLRAYATNGQGTTYGAEIDFSTKRLPEVSTEEIKNITSVSAYCVGNVTNQGDDPVIEKGVCWSSEHNPTMSNSSVSNGAGIGIYTCYLSGLAPGTKYYVRTYAINGFGVSYGGEEEFSTLATKPVVATTDVSHITQTSAQSGGIVTDEGGLIVTERGICWNNTQNPTIDDFHQSSGSGLGEFTVSMSNLYGGMRYYVRAYAINDFGISYGGQKYFNTEESKPIVITDDVNDVTQSSAQVGGNVIHDGGFEVTGRGVCWSISPNPNISGWHASVGSGVGSYNYTISGLIANTTYYVRAYATNSQGTSYGSEVSFTTQSGGGSGTLTFTANGVTFEMIEVEGGTFWMGAQSSIPSWQNYDSEAEGVERPVHQVTLSSYYIGKFEVTQQLWQAVMGNNPSHFTGDIQRPVEMVSWNDCQTFITALNELCASQLNGKHFSLPTEAQWEFAARGGNRSQGYKYSGSNWIGNVAWYTGNSGSTTHAVGTLLPNELGLYDMSGNVYEWCSDRYGNYDGNAQTDPIGPSSGTNLVNRGGCWGYGARSCRVSSRWDKAPADSIYFLGLRLSLR